MFSTPRLCSYAAVVVWAWAGVAVGSYDEFMSCGSNGGGGRDDGGGGRDGFGRNFHYRPEVPCDLARNGWCETAGKQYPWQSVRRFVYENQGLMKRMYGDQRHINVLRTELMDNMFDEMAAPNVYNYQPHLSEPPPVSSSRNGKKIKRNGRAGARAMEVTMEPVVNKNVPISKTSQKKSSISSSKTYSRVSNKGNRQEIRQKVPPRNRPPKAPPSERRRVPVKPKLKIKSKVGSTSSTKSTSPTTATTDTTATSASSNTPSTSPATTISTKDESTESTRTTRQMQDRITTTSDGTKAESELETTIRNKQHSSETTASANQSSTTEEVSTTEQETIEPTTNDPTTTSVSGVESTVEIDSYTTVEEDTESATLLQAEFREGAGPEIYDGSYESTYNSFDLYEKPIGGPSRHSETLTTAPGRTQETFSSYTSISSDAAPPSSLTANTPSLAEFTKEYESSTARSEFPLDFGDDFLSASQDDGDLEIIMFEEEIAADREEPRPLSLKERIAQDYRSSTEGSDLTTISLAERIDQAVDVRITGSSYPKDEIDLALEETIAEDASFTAERRRDEVETEEEEEVAENEENIGNKPPDPFHMRPPKGINACPVKGEVQSPYWANNTRGEVLALLNMYPFEQYIHMEKCVHENRQMYCRNGCRCEQQYRLHRLLAFDPTNECRGIFSDWFSFPSCCVCKCYNLHHNIFEGSSRRPRLQSNPDDEYFYDDEEYYYDDDEEGEEDEEFNEAEYITDGDYVIEDFNLEQFEHQDTEVKSKRNSRARSGSVPPSKIQPQRAPRPLGRPKSHIAPPGPSLLPPSPNLLPPPASSINKHQGRYEINTRVTVDTITPTVYNNDSTWMRENGRALPLFRITRNTPENEEEETPEKD